MDSLPAVVLAAGEGVRLRPLTRHRPKPMLPAANKPILAYVFDGLIEAGVSDITVVVGYGRGRVQDHFGPTYRNVPLTYVRQQKQLGTGHALLAVEDRFDDEPFLVVYGDQILDSRIVRDVINDTAEETAATIGVLDHNRVEHYGGVIMDGNRVTDLVERPADERRYRLNAGIYGLRPRIFEAIRSAEPRDGEHSLIDALSWLVDETEVRGTITDGLWMDATYPWDLLEVMRDLTDAGVVGGTRDERIEDSATLHETVVIRDPVVIGPDVEVGPETVLGPYTCLGENVTVGSGAIIEGSVLDSDTRVGPNATLVDCVTGQGVHIGAASTVPGGPGDVRIGDRVFERKRLGALLADRVDDHGATTFTPGTMVGSDTTVRAGTRVDGTIEEETEIR